VDIEGLPRSIAMWRQQTVWLGGIGIIVLFIAVLPRMRVGGRQMMFKTEMPGPEIGLQETIRESARRFVVLYLGLTALFVLVFAALGWTGVDRRMTLFAAIAHAFATIATGGFSTEARSIEAFAPTTQWVIVVFMLVAGTNFTLLYAGIVRRRMAAFARDEEFRAYLFLLAAGALVVFVSLIGGDVLAGEGAVRHAVFNTASMMTTTGFASADFATWPPVTATVLFGLTLLGASAGSTSGSIKLIRHLVVFKMLRRELAQTLQPELV
jgi:trk system potassium uptake protein TrkH